MALATPIFNLAIICCWSDAHYRPARAAYHPRHEVAAYHQPNGNKEVKTYHKPDGNASVHKRAYQKRHNVAAYQQPNGNALGKNT
jgi:hypothetical protein